MSSPLVAINDQLSTTPIPSVDDTAGKLQGRKTEKLDTSSTPTRTPAQRFKRIAIAVALAALALAAFAGFITMIVFGAALCATPAGLFAGLPLILIGALGCVTSPAYVGPAMVNLVSVIKNDTFMHENDE